MNRRNFIKISALTGTSATLASCGNPEYHLIRFVPEDQITPGIAEWKPSVCPLCAAGCGVIARVMEGETEVFHDGQRGVTKMGLVKKLEGNPQHPISQGKLCTRGQAAMEITYHPDRVGHPLKRAGARGDGKFVEISWDQALNETAAKLDELAAANNQKTFAFLTRPQRGLRGDLAAQFAKRFGGQPLVFEFFTNDVLRRANEISFGKHQLPTLDLAAAKYVVSFGADFLGTWNSPVAQNAGYGEMRQGRPGSRGKFVQFEYRMSQTGANADEWLPVKPGLEGAVALGIAHAIMKSGAKKPADAGQAGASIEGWTSGLPAFSPQDVENKTGVKAARIEKLAKEFVEQKPAVAIIGGAALAQTNGLFNAVAVNALNALAGSVRFMPVLDGNPEGGQFGVRPSELIKQGSDAYMSGLQMLFIDGANPVFASPMAWKIAEKLRQIPYIVSFGNFIDETSVMADLILPDHSFLESWNQSMPESGAKVAVANLAPPVMRPLHETRSTPDVLLDLAKRLKKPLDFPWKDFREMLKSAFDSLPVEKAWETAQKQGGWWGEIPKQTTGALYERSTRPQPPPAVKYADPQFDGDANRFPFHFLPYSSQAFLDGSLAHLPLLQELPDPMSSAVWSSWVEINLQTAEKLGIRQGDLVEITSSAGAIRVPAFPSPGIAPDALAMPVGQGHENFTRYATGRGENPIRILAALNEPETGSLAWAATRVQVTKVAEADGRLILFAGSLRDYPGEKVHR